jgi:hypothetical protein
MCFGLGWVLITDWGQLGIYGWGSLPEQHDWESVYVNRGSPYLHDLLLCCNLRGESLGMGRTQRRSGYIGGVWCKDSMLGINQ